MITDIEKKIGEIRKNGPGPNASPADKADWKDRLAFHAAAAVHFMYIKDAFRNRTIHETKYLFTEEKALSTYSHTREFMEHLAIKLKESTP